MRFDSANILAAVFTTLSGNVTIGGHPVPVYSFNVGARDKHYICISPNNTIPSRGRDCNTLEYFFNVEAVSVYNNVAGSFVDNSDICQNIISLLQNNNLILPDNGLTAIATLESSQTFDENDGRSIVIRTVLTFRFSPNK
jgi:hypothetical protein